MRAYETLVEQTLDVDAPPETTGQTWYLGAPRSIYFPTATTAAVVTTLALCGVFLLTNLMPIHHTDIWGHLALGRWIAEHGELPQVEPFSLALHGKPLVNLPWLAQLGGFLAVDAFGPEAIAFIHALCVTLGCGLLILAVVRRGLELEWGVFAAVACFCIGYTSLGAVRPQLFGFIGFPLCLLAVHELRKSLHPLYWIGPLFAVWANLHGSLVMGLGVLGIAAAAATFDALADKRRLRLALREPLVWRTWLILFIAAAGTCVNPSGPLIFGEILSFGGQDVLNDIAEWRQLSFKTIGGALFLVSLGVTALVVRLTYQKLSTLDILLLLVFCAAGFYAQRMIIWWALVWPWALGPHLAEAFQELFDPDEVDGEEGDDYERPNDPFWVEAWVSEAADGGTTMNTLFILGVVFMTLLFAPSTHAFVSGKPRGEGLMLANGTPIVLADVMAREGWQGNVFAPIDWADFLIWHSHGQIRPLAYTHVHSLPDALWQEHQQIRRGDSNWLEIVDQRGITFIVVRRHEHHRLHLALRSEPRAMMVYENQDTLLFQILPPDATPASDSSEIPDGRAGHAAEQPAASSPDVTPSPAPREHPETLRETLIKALQAAKVLL